MIDKIKTVVALEGGQYKVTDEDGAVKFIPDDIRNADRRMIDEWVKAGNVIQKFTKSIEDVKTEALSAVSGLHSKTLAAATGGASLGERDTWMPKALAAEAIVSGVATDFQKKMIDFEAGITGETSADLAAKILVNYSAYHSLIGIIAGHKRKAEDAIKSLDDAKAIDAVVKKIAATYEAVT